MKNPVTWIVLAIAVAVSSMVGIHWREARGLEARVARVETLSQREPIADRMLLELEHYRRLSGSFRKMSEADIGLAKSKLRGGITEGVQALASLDPTAPEKAQGEELEGEVADFMALSAKLEPQLFLRDVFMKQPARDLHDAMVEGVRKLKTSAAARSEAARRELASDSGESTRWLAGSALATLALALLLVARYFLVFQRPLRRLRERALAIRGGAIERPEGSKALRATHGEVEAVMTELATAADTLRKQRHQFVTAVATDLRAPLISLQAGANLLASVSDRLSPEQRAQAGEAVNRAAYRLSRSLEDLSDIVDTDRSANLKLDEKIVDIRGLVGEVTREIGGRGSSHPIELSTPAAPIWTMVDPPRFERVLVHLVSKMITVMPQGGAIHVSVNRPSRGEFRGLEIVIQDAQRVSHGRGAPTGPELELIRHWVSQNGFGMALAQKIVQAHGGTITASGIAGTGVLFTLRLPQERVASGSAYGGAAASQIEEREAGGASTLDISALQAMFPEQAMTFGA